MSFCQQKCFKQVSYGNILNEHNHIGTILYLRQVKAALSLLFQLSVSFYPFRNCTWQLACDLSLLWRCIVAVHEVSRHTEQARVMCPPSFEILQVTMHLACHFIFNLVCTIITIHPTPVHLVLLVETLDVVCNSPLLEAAPRAGHGYRDQCRCSTGLLTHCCWLHRCSRQLIAQEAVKKHPRTHGDCSCSASLIVHEQTCHSQQHKQ